MFARLQADCGLCVQQSGCQWCGGACVVFGEADTCPAPSASSAIECALLGGVTPVLNPIRLTATLVFSFGGGSTLTTVQAGGTVAVSGEDVMGLRRDPALFEAALMYEGRVYQVIDSDCD